MPKVTQVFYSGLGGQASVAFSLIEANKDEQKINFNLLFYGIEDLVPEYKNRCDFLQIPYISIKKKRGADFSSYLRYYQALKAQNPSSILLHSTNLIIPSLTYTLFHKCKVIAVEHTSNKTKLEKIWSFVCMFFASDIVVLSDDYEQRLAKIIGIFYIKNKVRIINNGIDIKKFSFTEHRNLSSQSNPIRIGMLSRLSLIKDHATLIKAIQLLITKEKLDVKLIIAGEGETIHTLIQLSKDLDIEKHIEFTGLLNEDECHSLLNNLDIYAHSSVSEIMSTAIMQAMSCGLPIVASNVQGINDMLTDGETGLLFELGNEIDLADKINALIQNNKLRKELAINASNFAHTNYSNVAMFEKYYELIR